VPVLVAGGLYLTRGPASPARHAAAASPAPAGSPTGTAVTLATPQPCAGACTPSPVHVGLAHAPARARASQAARPASPASPSGRLAASGPGAPGHSASGSAGARPSRSASQSAPSQQGTPADQVLALINQARAAAGLPPLTVTAGLDASASAHNQRMTGGCGLSHQCPGESALGARETAAGVRWTAAGENIGEGGPVPDTTAAIAQMAVTLTQDMLNEKPPGDGHRLNILSSTFTHIGIAVSRDSSGTVWLSQDFSN
jgi:uncharacterized protein YkwD